MEWISPVDRARMGNGNDIMSRLDDLETDNFRHKAINVGTADVQELTDDLGLVRTGALYFGSGDPYDLTTLPVGVLIEALGVHVYNQTEVARFGDLNGFLSYITDIDGIAIGDPTAYLTYDPTNGLRIKGTITTVGNYPELFDVWDETISGVDGASLIFNTQSPIVTGTLHIIQNGLWMFAEVGPDSDYETSPGTRFSFASPVVSTDELRVNYTKLADRTLVYNETPTQSILGNFFLYDTAFAYQTNSLQLTVNGISLDKVRDYHGGSNGFGFLNAPFLGDTVQAAYLTTPNAKFVGMEKLTAQVNGTATVFTLANNYQSGTPLLVLNGVKQALTADYTESAANQLTMVQAPLVGDHLWVTYLKQ